MLCKYVRSFVIVWMSGLLGDVMHTGWLPILYSKDGVVIPQIARSDRKCMCDMAHELKCTSANSTSPNQSKFLVDTPNMNL